MKPALFGTIIGVALLALPAASFAASYQYVNTSGMLSTVTADSAAQALTVSDLAPHSGVILMDDTILTGTPTNIAVVSTTTATTTTGSTMGTTTATTTVTSTQN